VYSKAFWESIQVTEDDDFNRKSLRYISWAGSDNKLKNIIGVEWEHRQTRSCIRSVQSFDTWKKDASWKKLGSELNWREFFSLDKATK